METPAPRTPPPRSRLSLAPRAGASLTRARNAHETPNAPVNTAERAHSAQTSTTTSRARAPPAPRPPESRPGTRHTDSGPPAVRQLSIASASVRAVDNTRPRPRLHHPRLITRLGTTHANPRPHLEATLAMMLHPRGRTPPAAPSSWFRSVSVGSTAHPSSVMPPLSTPADGHHLSPGPAQILAAPQHRLLGLARLRLAPVIVDVGRRRVQLIEEGRPA